MTRRTAMTATEKQERTVKRRLANKAARLLTMAARIEVLVSSLPPDLRDQEWKTGIRNLINRVEKAAQIGV